MFPFWILTSFLSLRWFPNALGLNPTGLSSEERPDETHFPSDYDTEGRGDGQEGDAPLDGRWGGNGSTGPGVRGDRWEIEPEAAQTVPLAPTLAQVS